MLRQFSVIIVLILLSIFCLNGCKKRPEQAEPNQKGSEAIADYEAEAKEQIDKENMSEELERIEKALEQEMEREQ